ncbi:MAG: hypothetical protein WEB93_05685 [Sphingomonadales bacterium]
MTVAALAQILETEITRPVSGTDPLIAAIRQRFGNNATAILFYGSCLRTGQFQGAMLDFYVLVDGYRDAYGADPRGLAAAVANRILPPNVYYVEAPDGQGDMLRAKYAVLSVDHFARLCSAQTFNSSVWVRFAQPTRLIYARDSDATRRVVDILSTAVRTAVHSVIGVIGEPVTVERIWCELFRESYRVELRAEGGTRAQDIFAAAADRYETVTPPAMAALGYVRDSQSGAFNPGPGARNPSGSGQRLGWLLRCWQGKALSVLRLIKAAFTFDGGIDYLAWKIQRHSGVEITISPWQRRHPVLAGLVLFWRLRLKGAFR